jgi:hypothetical protein
MISAVYNNKLNHLDVRVTGAVPKLDFYFYMCTQIMHHVYMHLKMDANEKREYLKFAVDKTVVGEKLLCRGRCVHKI